MSIDIKNYIIEKIKEINPNIDTRVGSVFRDFMINPFSSLLAEYQKDHDDLVKQQAITDLATTSTAALDAVGANFLIGRNEGTISSGFIKLYFAEPQAVNIPTGTVLTTSQGLRFETIAPFNISRFQMEQNLTDFPNYDSGNILLQAQEPGIDYNVALGTVFSFGDAADVTPVRITAATVFTGGTVGESNATFFSRLQDTVHNKTLASPAAIESTIKDNYTDVVNVAVVGAGHPLMIRDLTNYTNDIGGYISEEFIYVYSGLHTGTYDKGHIAMADHFIDSDETAAVSIPMITGWNTEFSNDMYRGVWVLDDVDYTEDTLRIVAREFFDELVDPNSEQSELELVLMSGGWQVHDGSNATQQLYFIDEIGVEGQRLRLGESKDITSEEAILYVTQSEMTSVLDEAGSSIDSGATLTPSVLTKEPTAFVVSDLSPFSEGRLIKIDNEIMQISQIQIPTTTLVVKRGYMGSEKQKHFFGAAIYNYDPTMTRQQLTALIAMGTRLLSDENFNNLSPIFHKQIDQHLGIEITFTFETTDNTEDGEMAYATVLRNSEVFAPHDGYGLAWRKQPSFLLRMQANTHTDEDLETFAEHYDMTVAQAADYVGTIGNIANKAFWKYNVYLVDNDILQEEIWIGHDQLWDQTSGRNQFLQAAKAWIEPSITYQVKLKIYQSMAVDAWIFDTSNPPADPYSNANRILNRGATYPPYVPASGDRIRTDTGIDILYSARNHFGFAVAQTRNYKWYFDTLVIASFVQTFPQHLFRFQMTDKGFILANRARINYYGVGYDPVRYALDGNVGHSQVKASAWNETQGQWDEIGNHQFTIDDTRPNQLITGILPVLSDYVDGEGFVNIAATPTNSGPGFSNNTVHALRSYYVELNNIELNQVHRGNAMDIYVHDPDNILTGTASVVMSSNTINTATIPGISNYIQEILEVREGISKVPFDTTAYTITNSDTGSSYSSSANYKISFDQDNMAGALIEIVYRYWTNGDGITALFAQEENTFPTTDQLIKVMTPTVVVIERLQYSGGITEAQMKLAIVEYFNNLTDTVFDKSDLINVLYNNGANYVDLNMAIQIREYDTEAVRTTVKMDSQTYTIRTDVVSNFYTHIDEIDGVTQI